MDVNLWEACATLGIRVEECAYSTVRKAFLRMALRYHPDKIPMQASSNEKNEARNIFEKAVHAYHSILSSFDVEGTVGVKHTRGSDDRNPRETRRKGEEGEEGEEFEYYTPMGFMSTSSEEPRVIQLVDLVMNYSDIKYGTMKRVRVQSIETCPSCEGTGIGDAAARARTCPICDGDRVVTASMGPRLFRKNRCDGCDGKGKIRAKATIDTCCLKCRGRGTITKLKEIELHIKACTPNFKSYFVDVGMRHTYLVIIRYYLPDPTVFINFSTGDITKFIKINLEEALLGFDKKTICLPDGKKFVIKTQDDSSSSSVIRDDNDNDNRDHTDHITAVATSTDVIRPKATSTVAYTRPGTIFIFPGEGLGLRREKDNAKESAAGDLKVIVDVEWPVPGSTQLRKIFKYADIIREIFS